MKAFVRHLQTYYQKMKKFPSRVVTSFFFQATVALSGLVAAASAAPEPWVVPAGPVIAPALVDPHATSGLASLA